MKEICTLNRVKQILLIRFIMISIGAKSFLNDLSEDFGTK